MRAVGHRAELVHVELVAPESDPTLAKDDRAGTGEPNQGRDQEQERGVPRATPLPATMKPMPSP